MVKIKEACGLYGIYGDPDAAELTYQGLLTLQHRGLESAGICASHGSGLQTIRGMGRVASVFGEPELASLKSTSCIGHVRYSTYGDSSFENSQPIQLACQFGDIAIAHNGQITNAEQLRRELSSAGVLFVSRTDSEVVLHLLARAGASMDFDSALIHCLSKLEGAFSLLIMLNDRVLAVRDPLGMRPLWFGRRGSAYAFASESAAFDVTGVDAIEEVAPGTVVEVSMTGVRSLRFSAGEQNTAHCLFEHVYFARPDSVIFGDLVQRVRFDSGRELAREFPATGADVVTAIPSSGCDAAAGYAAESGLPLARLFIRNQYIDRTFIQPKAAQRKRLTDMKFNVVKSAVKAKSIVVVDDSIVRGQTVGPRLEHLRQAGAAAIHLRIACPPVVNPCRYGLDFQTRNELIAANYELEELRKELGVDSLGFLSLPGLIKCVSKPETEYCHACWSGQYPILRAPSEPVVACKQFHV